MKTFALLVLQMQAAMVNAQAQLAQGYVWNAWEDNAATIRRLGEEMHAYLERRMEEGR